MAEEDKDADYVRSPWWIRASLAIVSKEGIERLIAIVFIGSVVFVGYRILQLLESVGTRHMQFIDVQTALSVQNANTLNHSVETLKTISGLGERIEGGMHDLRSDLAREHKMRFDEHKEHKMMLEEVKKRQ